ncbi:MAG: hypothetical protein KDD74_10215 [Anaerolineales bacterium]|nr:hypothetical protein [Anaerolineales bacterium]
MSVNFTKVNCDAWVNYAYLEWLQWAREIKPREYHLRESTRILVRRMRAAIENGDSNGAWNLLGQLKKLGNGIYDMRNDFGTNGFLYEQSEINLECAIAAYLMDDRREASSLLDAISGNFIHQSIHKAVTCWISGCIHWQSQTHFDAALVNWEKGFQIVTDLARDTAFEETFAEGCARIASEMDDAIRRASNTGFPPPPPRRVNRRPNPGAGFDDAPPQEPDRPSSPPHRPRGSGGFPSALLKSFPVLGSIPAGSPLGIVDDSSEEAVIDGIEINGAFYNFHSLVGGSEINISQNKQYFILKVNGDSMNNTMPVHIESGDYVLMVKQDAAESGDIVAAEIENDGREATLKRYFYSDGKYILKAQSRNPQNDHLTFRKDFYIRGKALAVLKRER